MAMDLQRVMGPIYESPSWRAWFTPESRIVLNQQVDIGDNHPVVLEHDRRGLLLLTALLEGCSYYGCRDDLKNKYLPDEDDGRWLDSQTLEISFYEPLRSPAGVDPGRFALLRFNTRITGGSYYGCDFELCFDAPGPTPLIPESLDWDPKDPKTLRLHFAEPVSADACEPWGSNHADYQALTLVYIGDWGIEAGQGRDYRYEYEYLGEVPELLLYRDWNPVHSLGPADAVSWIEGCIAGGACDFESFCQAGGGSDDEIATAHTSHEYPVSCP